MIFGFDLQMSGPYTMPLGNVFIASFFNNINAVSLVQLVLQILIYELKYSNKASITKHMVHNVYSLISQK